jgi:hypothetical protein
VRGQLAAILGTLAVLATTATAQAPGLPEPEFDFVMEDLTFSTYDDLVAGVPMQVTVPVARLCPVGMALLDEQQVLVTPNGPAYRIEAPLLLEFPQTACELGNDPVVLVLDITPLGTLNGSQSLTVGLDPQEPETGLHGPGQPKTLVLGMVVAAPPPPVAEPAPPVVEKESPAPIGALMAFGLLVLAAARRA